MKKVLGITLAVILIIAAIFFGGMYWHNKEMNALAEQIEQENENGKLMQERLKIITDSNKSLEEKIADLKKQNDSLPGKVEQAIQAAYDSVTEEVAAFDAAVVEEEIRNCSELASIEYYHTTVGSLDSVDQFSNGWNVPFSQKTVIFSMDGIIKAGVDLSKVKIESDENNKIITIYLPNPTYLSNELREDSLTVYLEETTILNPVTVTDTNDIRKQIKDKAIKQADNNKLLEQANTHAQQLIRNIIEAVPGVKGIYEIIFETK